MRPKPQSQPNESGEYKTGKRLSGGVYLHVTTSEPEYSDEEITFFKAVDNYKTKYRRQFPTLRELLFVLKSIGYTLVHKPIDYMKEEEKP